MTEKNWPVMTEIPVLWGDMDSFGHVNNIIYLKWCETSRIELFCRIWDLDSLKMDDILDTNVVTHSKNVKSGVGPILANFNTNYRIPVVCPDTIYVKTRIMHIGNTSFGIEHQITSKNNGSNIVAEADSVVVMINYKTGEKFQIDDDNRKKLEAFAQNLIFFIFRICFFFSIGFTSR